MVRQYVGARYVPKFADPVAWASGTSYEAMTIVTYNNSSYTSKIPVPATVGNPAGNPDYWALTGNYNAQVEQYRQETETVSNNLTTEITNRKNADTTLQGQITTIKEQYEQLEKAAMPYVTYRMFGAVLDGITDDSAAVLACHAYANTTGKKVFERGGALLCNFTVDVKTDCDLNIDFIINDNTPATVYNIKSETIETSFNATANLTTGQNVFPSDDGRLFGKFFIPRRTSNDWLLGKRYSSSSQTIHYHHQPVCVNNMGEIVSSRIYFGSTGVPNITQCKSATEKGIVFSGGHVIATLSKIGFPSLVKCERCNCEIRNITISNTTLPNLSTNYDSGLIDINGCCNIIIDNIVGFNNSVDLTTNFSYVINVTDAYNVTIRNCNLTQGWGAIATHFCDTITVYNCVINRVDNHYGCFGKWTIKDCIIANDISLGYGDGEVNILNTTFQTKRPVESMAPYAIYTRKDFNVIFGGNLFIENIKTIGNYNCLIKWQVGTQEAGYEANEDLQKSNGKVHVVNTDIQAHVLMSNTVDKDIQVRLDNVTARPFTGASKSTLIAYNSSLYRLYGLMPKTVYNCEVQSLMKDPDTEENAPITIYNSRIYAAPEDNIQLKAINSVFLFKGNVSCKSFKAIRCYAQSPINVTAETKEITDCINVE